MLTKLIKNGNHYYSIILMDNKKLLATTEDVENVLKLSLKNCQAIECGYDLDELADEYCTHEPKNVKELRDVNLVKLGFRDGFQKAVELLGDKKFSEEDVISMIEKSRETGLTAEYLILTKQQTEWDVEVEMQKYLEGYEMIGHQKGVYGSGNRIPIYNSKPKLDTDGCLILKLKSE